MHDSLPELPDYDQFDLTRSTSNGRMAQTFNVQTHAHIHLISIQAYRVHTVYIHTLFFFKRYTYTLGSHLRPLYITPEIHDKNRVKFKYYNLGLIMIKEAIM